MVNASQTLQKSAECFQAQAPIASYSACTVKQTKFLHQFSFIATYVLREANAHGYHLVLHYSYFSSHLTYVVTDTGCYSYIKNFAILIRIIL